MADTKAGKKCGIPVRLKGKPEPIGKKTPGKHVTNKKTSVKGSSEKEESKTEPSSPQIQKSKSKRKLEGIPSPTENVKVVNQGKQKGHTVHTQGNQAGTKNSTTTVGYKPTNFTFKIDTKFGLNLKSPETGRVKKFSAKPKPVRGYTELRKAEEQLRKHCEKLEAELAVIHKNHVEELSREQQRNVTLTTELSEQTEKLEKLQQETTSSQEKLEEERRKRQEEWTREETKMKKDLNLCERILLQCQIDPVTKERKALSLEEAREWELMQKQASLTADCIQKTLEKRNQLLKDLREEAQQVLSELED